MVRDVIVVILLVAIGISLVTMLTIWLSNRRKRT